MKNMHNSLNLELFCTYSKKRNLRSGEGERRLLGTTIFTSKFHNAVILNWLRWFLLWSCGFRGKMWICWFISDCETLQQALDILQDWSMHNGWCHVLFGANLMFVLDQFTFVLAKGWLAFYIKRERIDQMGLGALPQSIQPLEKLP